MHRPMIAPTETGTTGPMMPFERVHRLALSIALALTFAVLARGLQFGPSPLWIPELLTGAALILALVAPPSRLGQWRVAVISFAFLAIPVFGLAQFGLATPETLGFLGGCVFASVYVSPVHARYLLGLQIGLLAAFAAGFETGILQPVADLSRVNAGALNWIVLASALIVVSFFTMRVIGGLRSHLAAVTAEQELGRRQFEMLLHHAPDGIAIQDIESGTFLCVNPRTEMLLGMSSEDLVGKKGFLDVSSAVQTEGGELSPTRVDRLFREALEGSTPKIDWMLQTETGEDVLCNVTLARLPSDTGRLVRISLTDVSLQREARRLRDLMAVLFRKSNEGVILCDAKGRVETVNPIVERDIGIGAAELLGRSIGEYISEPQRAEILSSIRETGRHGGNEGTCWNGEAELLGGDGKTVPAWITVNSVRDQNGRLLRFVVLLRNLSWMRRADAEIRRRSEVDFLTGLPNRLRLIRFLAEIGLDDAGEHMRETALLSLDIDRLKRINDRYGQEAGDSVLRQLGFRLRSCLASGDLLVRHSGDEFAIVLATGNARERIAEVNDQIRDVLRTPFRVDGAEVHLDLSIGAAIAPLHASDPAGLIGAADQALHVAKSDRRCGLVTYSEEIDRQARERLCLIEELQTGLERDHFRLAYQPIVDIDTGRVVKAEALLRWNHPQFGEIGPDRFIPLAEENGLIHVIGDWVLRQSCEDLPVLRERFGSSFQVSVNVSPLQLAEADEARMERWKSLLSGTARSGPGLVLEITESALLDPTPEMVTRLDALRAAGAGIALDDFGAGHTSLLYYLSHDFDFLKIDREIVRNMPGRARAVAVCTSILGFAKRLDAVAVAEGVETPDQVEILRRGGCRYVQGYLFSSPLPLAEFLELRERFDLAC